MIEPLSNLGVFMLALISISLTGPRVLQIHTKKGKNGNWLKLAPRLYGSERQRFHGIECCSYINQYQVMLHFWLNPITSQSSLHSFHCFIVNYLHLSSYSSSHSNGLSITSCWLMDGIDNSALQVLLQLKWLLMASIDNSAPKRSVWQRSLMKIWDWEMERVCRLKLESQTINMGGFFCLYILYLFY